MPESTFTIPGRRVKVSRLSKDITLGPVSLRVAERARTATWLERVLGLTSLGQDRWGGPTGMPLVAAREVPGARRVPPAGRLGLYHYALRLPSRADLGQLLLHLESLGERWAASDHLFSEALYLTDPDGITVEVYADRPRDQWVWRGSDLVGAIDPLDTAAVVAAAAGGTWRGFPAGGIMGHLHFYVGDLHEASRFYVDALGFDVSTRLFPGALFIAAGGYHHHLGLNVWAAHQPVAGPLDAGLDEWTLVLPLSRDADELVVRANRAEVPVEREDGAWIAVDRWNLRVRIVTENR